MIRIASLLVIAFALVTPAEARNYPCSRGKGGVKACTASGHFLCRNGTISASKYRCTGYPRR